MLTTSIGSLPFIDVERAVETVLTYCPEVPFWPQLPRRSFHEDFYGQFLEGVPSVVLDEQAQIVYVDTRRTAGIERFYEDVAAGNTDAFAISEQAGPGLYRLLQRIPQVKDQVRFIKIQLTGPFSLGMGVKDENGRSIIYDKAFFDIIKKGLRMKAQWLIKTVQQSCPGTPIVLFFDEPSMVSFGSAFVSVSREEVIESINEVAEGLDATVGVHCCGNTDWPVLFDTKIDIINYDAFAFLETIFYFPENLKAFFARGGRIAPGIAPTLIEAIDRTTPSALRIVWESFQQKLLEVGLYPAKEEVIVTTACGLGAIDEDHTLRALNLLRSLLSTPTT